MSVGIVDGQILLDLDYAEDSRAGVDMSVVMTGRGEFVELQGTGEGCTYSDEQLQKQVNMAKLGIRQLSALQRAALGSEWPLDSISPSC